MGCLGEGCNLGGRSVHISLYGLRGYLRPLRGAGTFGNHRSLKHPLGIDLDTEEVVAHSRDWKCTDEGALHRCGFYEGCEHVGWRPLDFGTINI